MRVAALSLFAGVVLSAPVDARAAAARSSTSLKVAVAPFQGKGNAGCTRAIAEIAREQAKVEPWRSVSREKLPRSWADLSVWLGTKGNEIGADVLILGVASRGKLILQAYDPKRVKLIGLKRLVIGKKCKLGASAKADVSTWFGQVLERSQEPESAPLVERETAQAEKGSNPEKTERAEEPAEPEEPLALKGRDPGLSEADRAEAPERPSREARARREEERAVLETELEPAASVRRRAMPLVAVEAEMSFVNRSFGYTDPHTTNLRTLEVAGMPTPGVRLEAHPFARADAKASGGPAFIEAFYRRALGVKSARTDGGPDHDSRFEDAGLSAGYRWVGTRLGIAVSPHIGYRFTQFSLLPARNGLREQDVPNVAYSSLDLGIAAEVPVKDWVSAVVSGSYLVVFSAGEVFSRAYFASGSALAFDLSAGLRFMVAPSVSVGVLGAYQSFALSLNSDPDAPRSAESASDSLLSVRTVARFEF